MKKVILLINFVLITFLLVSVQAQSKFPPSGSSIDRNQEIISELRRRNDLEKEIAEINKGFAVPQKYKAKYPKFLKKDNAGLLRLLPDQNCNKGLTVNIQDLERCNNLPNIRGAGSIYSFRLAELPNYLSFKDILFYIGESDLHFVNNKFVVGKELTLGVITEIGKTNLENITSKSIPIELFSKWKLVKNENELSEQKLLLEKGINIEGYSFSNAVEVKKDSTYIFRSIAYRGQKRSSFWNTDILVAFQVIGEESDGSIIIIWKRLKKSDAPYLKT